MEFQPNNPEITLEQFETAFADFRRLPSHLQSVQTESLNYPTDIVKVYETTIEAVRDSFYDKESTSEDLSQKLDQTFLLNCFASSDGGEIHLMLLGLKPVVFVSDCYSLNTAREYFNSVPAQNFSGDRVIREGRMGANFGFTPGTVDTNNAIEMHGGFVYNLTAVERIAQDNALLFTRLGYNPVQDGATFAESVLSSPNVLAHSVLLGYSPMSSVFFYLEKPSEMCPWTRMLTGAKQDRLYLNEFRRSLEALLNPEQLAIANRLMGNASAIATLGAQENQTTYEDYWRPSHHNQAAQKHLQASGFSDCVQKWSAALGSKPTSDGSPKFF